MKARLSTRAVALSGIVAAIYAAVTIVWPLSYGSVQFRLSEALCVLPAFVPVTGIGLTVGCLVANLFSTVSALDIVIGTLATAIGCLGASRCRRLWLIPLPTVLANTVLVGAMLAFVYTPNALLQGFLLNGAGVAFGEAVVLYGLGLPLAAYLRRSRVLERAGLQHTA